MQSKKVIKYKYAFNSHNQIVYIGDLERTPELKSQEFVCISCSHPLIPKLGQVRQKHFAHKNISNCPEETYLHKLAKALFLQEYQWCLENQEPFQIELEIKRLCNTYENYFGLICDWGNINKCFDLTKRYTKISLETREGEFIPDILLSDQQGIKKLFIEIAVTHSLTEKKSNSQFNIIEIQIDTEEDIALIKEKLIRQSDPKVKLINFDIQPEKKNFCYGSLCLNKIRLFLVFNTGKSILVLENYAKAYSRLTNKNNSIIYYEILNFTLPWGYADEYKKRIVYAYINGIKIKNCFLCRYHGTNWFYNDEEHPIYCKFLKIQCSSNYAAECQYYKPDTQCFPHIRAD